MALESNARIVETFLLALSIACGLTVLDRQHLKSGRENFADKKFLQINFCNFTLIAKNAKFKHREIFPTIWYHSISLVWLARPSLPNAGGAEAKGQSSIHSDKFAPSNRLTLSQ